MITHLRWHLDDEDTAVKHLRFVMVAIKSVSTVINSINN